MTGELWPAENPPFFPMLCGLSGALRAVSVDCGRWENRNPPGRCSSGAHLPFLQTSQPLSGLAALASSGFKVLFSLLNLTHIYGEPTVPRALVQTGTQYEQDGQCPALQTRAHLTFSIKRQTGNILGSASDRATLSQLLNSALVVEKQPETIQL